MRFTIDGTGAASVGTGLGNLLKAAALAPQLKQQAQMTAALRDSQIYQNNMQGNKAGVEAENTRFTLDQRQGIDNLIANDPALAPYMRNMMTAFKLTGDTNAERLAKSGTEFQTQGFRDQAAQNVGDVDQMNRFISLAADKAYEPFASVGNTGRYINQATGAGGVSEETLAKLFGAVQNSIINENNAQAANAGASAAIDNARLGILNETGSLPGTQGGGEDATNAKTRNAIIAAVEKDLPGALEEEITAEVDRRLARRGLSVQPPVKPAPVPNKNPSPAPAKPIMDAQATSQALDAARAAIARGAPRDKVIERLKQNGIEPAGL